MRALLDTSILIGGRSPGEEVEAAISVVSLAELHFGLLVARDDEARASRANRLGMIEARLPDPLPIDDHVAREWGYLQSVVLTAGGQPRRRISQSPRPPACTRRPDPPVRRGRVVVWSIDQAIATAAPPVIMAAPRS